MITMAQLELIKELSDMVHQSETVRFYLSKAVLGDMSLEEAVISIIKSQDKSIQSLKSDLSTAHARSSS